ncbi:unnamed protein product [Phaeothamnion confervicola]
MEGREVKPLARQGSQHRVGFRNGQTAAGRGMRRPPFHGTGTLDEGAASVLIHACRLARSSGKLLLSNRNLTSFPSEALRPQENTAAGDEKWWEALPLQHCDLTHNAIIELPVDLCRLDTLVVLRASHNALTALPSLELPALTMLDCSHNAIAALPNGFGDGLPSLRELVANNNHLVALPESLGRASALSTLRVAQNRLTSLPDAIGALSALWELDASQNDLAALPASLAWLSALRQLLLQRNRIRAVGGALCGLSRLAVLDLRENLLESFPTLPLPAPELAQVLLGHNALRAVDPAALLALAPACVELHLQSNGIAVLPAEVGAMAALRVLQVADNDIARLPPELGYLQNLTRLAVSGNPLKAVRRTLLEGGIEDLKKYLRTRGPAYSPPAAAAAAAAPGEGGRGGPIGGDGGISGISCGWTGDSGTCDERSGCTGRGGGGGGGGHNRVGRPLEIAEAELGINCQQLGGAALPPNWRGASAQGRNRQQPAARPQKGLQGDELPDQYAAGQFGDGPLATSAHVAAAPLAMAAMAPIAATAASTPAMARMAAAAAMAAATEAAQRATWLRAEADRFEEEAARPGLSQAKQFALKREARMARAALLREERALREREVVVPA